MKPFLSILVIIIEYIILNFIYIALDISVYNSYFAGFLLVIYLFFIIPFTWKKTNNIFKSENKDKVDLPEELAEFFNNFAKEKEVFNELKKSMNIENQELNVDGITNPNYGLSATNPIFVNGPHGANLYFLLLRTTNGEQLKWERIGSTESKGVPGRTDVYKGILQNGQKYIEIYVNWYGTTNSTVPPKGLIINL